MSVSELQFVMHGERAVEAAEVFETALREAGVSEITRSSVPALPPVERRRKST